MAKKKSGFKVRGVAEHKEHKTKRHSSKRNTGKRQRGK